MINLPQNPKPTHVAAGLRQRAEEAFQKRADILSPQQLEGGAPEAAQRTLHDLGVHQIELEMQNEELRRAYVEIEAARARYFNLYDLAPVGYITVSQQGLILEANLTVATLLGVGRMALVKKRISQFICREDQDAYYLVLKQLLDTKSSPQSESPLLCDLRMVKSDGTRFWAHWVAAAAEDESGVPTLHIVMSDISERKRTEEDLAVKNFIFDTSLSANSIADAEGIIIEANDSFLEVWGYDHKEDVVGKPVSHFFKDQSSATDILNFLKANGRWEGDFIGERGAGGSTFTAHGIATALRNTSGEIIGFQSSVMDCTALRQNEAKLVQLSQAVEQSPVLVVITNRAGDIEYVNPKFCEVTGYAREDVMGKNPRILKSGEKSLQDYKELWATIMAGKEWRGEFHNKKKSGEFYWESASISPIRNASGHIDHFLAVKEDITERKQAEKELREKTAEMERFTATVSHDLKSPLVTIKTFLGYLEEDLLAKNKEAVDKDLGFIHGAADKMGFLLNELLDLARIGHKRNPSESVPLKMVVQDAIILVAGQIAQRGVRMDVTSEPIWLYGDRPRLVAVFENLIDNAVKFLGDQPDPRIEIGVETADSEIVLFVRDNGKGIDLRHQSKLFGLFEKLDPHTPGSGMGLAMVRRIIEIHGGKIWMKSDGLGCGTTFRFTLENTQLKL